MAVHQLIPVFTLGDATGQAALHLQLLLRRRGVFGELYAGEVAPPLRSLVKPASRLRPSADDWVLYHHGIASELSFKWMRLGCRRGVVFHNISPERFYRGAPLHEALLAGRAQLAAMARVSELSIGVSDFNAAELLAAGHRRVATVPLFVEPARFAASEADPAMAARLGHGGPSVLFVGRVVAHKRVEDLIALHRELMRLFPEARLRVVGGYEPGSALFRRLRREADEVGGVEFLGRLSHAELVAAYRSASVFVSMSEHEGFGVPLLEAMASEVPVLAFGAAAVPETMGGAGIVFDEKRFAFLAELVREVCEDGALRARLLEGQARRVRELSAEAAGVRLAATGLLSPQRRRELGRQAMAGTRHPGAGPAGHLGTGPAGHLETGPAGHLGTWPAPGDLDLWERSPDRDLLDGPVAVLRQAQERPLPQVKAHRSAKLSSAPPRPRVAVVVQRYGDVSGGAERHAQSIVEHLSPHWDLTVLTTCAKDHLTWENAFPAGESQLGPARVLRFPTEQPREMRAFNRLSREVFGRPNDRASEEHWIAEQGPLVPGLLRHLAEQGGLYDAFIFFTYLYAPTAWGLPLVSSRSLLVPTAHDEPPLSFHAYDDVLERPRALLCNTEEEVALIRRRFPRAAPAKVVGVGVDLPRADPDRFRAAHGISGPYLFYVGRLEEGKGVGELLTQHRAWVRRDRQAPGLVLAGGQHMRISGPKVRVLGRIPDQDKFDAIAGAHGVVVPSRLESLSLLTLESFAQGTPVLVNGASDVLVGQVRRSGAGAVYTDSRSLEVGSRALEEDRGALRKKARAYARRHRWDKVIKAYRDALADILENR